MKLKHLLLLLGVVNGLLVGSSNLFAQYSQSVNLAWDASPSPNVTSYVVYHGNASGSYANLTNVGNQTTARINGLQAGQTYFFAVTALNDAGVESLPSNEISYLVPVIDPPPSIALTAPADGASYATPATIDLAASVTTNGNTISKVQFYQGSALLGEDTNAPYTFTWSSVSTGSYSLSARAVYGTGSTAASAAVTVSVSTDPSSSGVTLGASSGTITAPFVIGDEVIYQTLYTATPAEGGRAAYTFTLSTAGDYVVSALVNAPDESANSFFVNINAEPTDPAMIWDIPLTSGLAERTVSWRGNGTFDSAQYVPKVFTLASGTHTLIVRGREANTQLGTITITPTDRPPGDTTAPTVSITAPANNATVSGSAVTVSANATDNVGVAGVQFKLNGADLGAEDTSAPYGVTWNTTSVADGTHTLTAVARDAAGNQATSTPLSIIVSNSAPVTPPTVTVVASDANASRAGLDNGAVTIARTGSTTSSLTVNYSLGGTAVNGTDYETLNTSVTMPVGATSVTLTVVPKSSATHVDAKTATLTLVAHSAYTVGMSGSASVKIAGNSVPISLKLTGKNATISWGSIAGRTYLVAYKANLSDANWTDLSGDITTTSTSTSWSDLEGSRFNQRYYTVYVTN